jgi:TRAP-type C4-dicarboxylate transport system permease small subunit
MKVYLRIVNNIGKGTQYLALLAICAAMLLIVANVALRFFGKPILGTYELFQLIIVVVAITGIIYAAIRGAHVCIDFVTKRIPKNTLKYVLIMSSLIILIYMIAMAWRTIYSGFLSWSTGETTSIMHYPVGPFRLVFGLGWGVMCLVIMADLFKALVEARK